MSFKILPENINLLSMIFSYSKSLFEIVFWQNFFNCHPIFKIFCSTFFDKLSIKFCKENSLPTVELNRKYLRNTVIRD